MGKRLLSVVAWVLVGCLGLVAEAHAQSRGHIEVRDVTAQPPGVATGVPVARAQRSQDTVRQSPRPHGDVAAGPTGIRCADRDT